MVVAAPVLVEQERPLTLEDYFELPDEPGERYEIIGGELIVSPTPISPHQEVALNLAYVLGPAIRERKLGKLYIAPTTVRLALHDIVEPDLIFVSTANRSLVRGGIIDGVPDLVVEILSPSNRRSDLVRKRALYAQAGVPEYWIVEIETRSIRPLQLVDRQYVEITGKPGFVASVVLPDLQIEIATIFADLWE